MVAASEAICRPRFGLRSVSWQRREIGRPSRVVVWQLQSNVLGSALCSQPPVFNICYPSSLGATRDRPMYSDSHRASRIASITLAVVLVALAGLASAGGLLAHQATERVARSTRINEAYERLRYALMLEEARKQKYLSELSREAEAYWAGAAFE